MAGWGAFPVALTLSAAVIAGTVGCNHSSPTSVAAPSASGSSSATSSAGSTDGAAPITASCALTAAEVARITDLPMASLGGGAATPGPLSCTYESADRAAIVTVVVDDGPTGGDTAYQAFTSAQQTTPQSGIGDHAAYSTDEASRTSDFAVVQGTRFVRVTVHGSGLAQDPLRQVAQRFLDAR
jgi:hypothetical protein